MVTVWSAGRHEGRCPLMVVCHCRAVNDRVIRQLIVAGHATADEVADRCGAGTDCGGCREAIEDLLAVIGRDGAGVR